MTYYKSLTKDNQGPFSDFDFSPYLPKGKRPGKWLPKVEELIICHSGYHACKDADIIGSLNSKIYEVEIRGKIVEDGDKLTTQQIRFVQYCNNWNEKTARLFACDCAERVLYIYEDKYPKDNRPRFAIQVARLFARDKATPEELIAAEIATWAATWAATGAAARDAAEAATWATTGDAAEAATWAATGAAARAAARAAAEAATGAATGAAARDAAEAAKWATTGAAARDAAEAAKWATTGAAERKWQKERLLQILEAPHENPKP